MGFDAERFRQRATLTRREYLYLCLQWLKEHPEQRRRLYERRRSRRLNAMPPWADRDAILALHREARRRSRGEEEQYRVEFVVPLLHPLVCGLYIAHNMWIVREGGRTFRWRRTAVNLLDELELGCEQEPEGEQALDESTLNRMIEEEFGDQWEG